MAEIKDPENTLVLETTKGTARDRAPPRSRAEPCRAHQGAGAARASMTASSFHRVIDGFMAQGG